MVCSGTVFRQLFYIALTSVIAYQALYNLVGANELGGPYMSFKCLLYSVGTLLPAIALGIHAFRLVGAKSLEEQEKLASAKAYLYICYFYQGMVIFMVLYRIWAEFQNHHQLAPIHLVSYKRSRCWLLYYYGVLQYGISFLLVAAY